MMAQRVLSDYPITCFLFKFYLINIEFKINYKVNSNSKLTSIKLTINNLQSDKF